MDGELYNRRELLRDLQLPESAADAEIVLRGYILWGADGLKRFNGMYAFIVQDNNGGIFMARDSLGMKRVFYYENNGLIHAFEIKDLIKKMPARPLIGREGLAEIFLLGPGRTPGAGIFEGVREVLPGQWVSYSREKGLSNGKYWQPEAKPHLHDFDETVETVRELLSAAVKSQLSPGGNVCSFLSGGLDSSAITALSGVQKTFSVDYTGNEEYFTPDRFQPDDDRAYIGYMVEHCNISHQNITLDTDDLADALADAAEARGFPGMGDVDASLLLFCRRVREQADTALSGEGADEIFGGYPWYRDETRLWEDNFPWSQSAGYRAGFAKPGVWDGLDPMEYVRARYESALAGTDCLPGDTPLEKRMRGMFMLNIHWFGQTLLERHERMSRNAGIRVRMPFCDHRLVEYMYNVPWEYKNYNGREKGLLREALTGLLPETVLRRKKSPYPKTHNPLYWKRVSEMLRDLLAKPNAPLFDIADRKAVASLLERPDDGPPWYGQLMTRPQTVAYFLQINTWMEMCKPVL
jgi:asparagine synthase (glutamine-hydrolysing)